MSLRIQTLGPFLVSRGDTPIPESAWKNQKNKTLLKILLTYRKHRLTRDQLLEWLWPDLDPDAADRSLRVATSQLREALEPDRPRGSHSSFLLTTEAGYAWNLQADYWLDAEEFEGLARSAALLPEDALDVETLSQLRVAANLYQGDYLAEDRYADWALVERERLRELHLALLTRLAGAHARLREYPQAVKLYRQVLAADPCRESVWRQLMLNHYHAGDQALARRAYEECQRALREELDVEPMPETQALYAQILRRAVPAPPSIIPHNLPPDLTPFIGRRAELAEIAGRLGDPASRLVTLVGPGGVGKTRLARQAAGLNRDRFPQGVYFVPLAAVSSAGDLVTALASALRFFFAGRAEPQAQLLDYLREKRLLLVLDGFEHLLSPTGGDEGGVNLLVDILQHAPDVSLLVTSRERLHLQAERALEIAGLSRPTDDASVEVPLAAYDAVQLFAERAGRVRQGFSLAQEGPAVARICQLVAGLPLGIELAAPWVRQLTCQEIAQEIARSLDFLATTMRDVPPPHRSLRAVFDRSWGLLAADERTALRSLSVFRGGFLREAAARVAGAPPAILAALAAQSLLRASPTGRYELHELVRQYAAEKLAEHPADEERLRDRHSAYYTDFLHQRTAALQGCQQREALDEVRAEVDNVRQAWQWAVERGQCEALDRSLDSLHLFYEIQGWYQEGLAAFGRAAASLEGRSGGERARGRALARQARCCERLGRYDQARELAQVSLALLAQPDAAADRVFVLNTLGSAAYLQGDFAEAGRLYQESYQASQACGDRYGAIRALYGRGLVAEVRGDYAVARTLFQDSLALAQEAADPTATARAANYLGLIACHLGEYAEAQERCRSSLALLRAIGDRQATALALDYLGHATLALGDYVEAGQLYQDSLTIRREIGNRWGIAASLDNLGRVACALGQYAAAAQWHRASLALSQETQDRGGIARALEGLAQVACARQEYEPAHDLVQQALAITQELGHRGSMARSLTRLGEIVGARGDAQTGLAYVRQALAIATAIGVKPLTLEGLAGAAALLAQSGEAAPAAELAAFVQRQPAAAKETRDQAARLLGKLQSVLPAEEWAAARARGQIMTLEEAVGVASRHL